MLDLLLDARRVAEALRRDALRDIVPEPSGFIRELLRLRGHDLGDGHQGNEIDEQLLLRRGVGVLLIFHRGRGRDRVVDLFLPAALHAGEDILLGDVLHPGDFVVLGVIAEDDADDGVLAFPDPAFFEVVQDDFYLRLWTGDVADVCNGDGEAPAEEAA